ncbi:succinyl-diaminopimelate desuccinylase [Desulfacinum hydrothermale DSM 13146]|uniref:Succinyl-diaminopimelate desuccinylase n=1 Tax=Desulfacinum hydrothermale DSM 13146 TaxID=1121390 RepID=A0A1W1XB02_9BACT|nr:M20/M25/M40 family metallo-hydrolase [Desulfacinum hydrothermale]SMC21013.1 succinyl-diaminopimelate desuccinylase [Desulfacinum hydrothermale DSM 13146]
MRQVIELTKELIRFPSMHSRPEEIRRCADFIADYLDEAQVAYRRYDVEGIPSILVTPEAGRAPVLLMSHLDVVDAPEELFDPVEKDGRLYGRGAIDDKYAVALSLVMLRHHMERLRAEGKGQDALGFGVLITGDEEIGGYRGAREVLKDVRADLCVALDGGSVDEIVLKEKGILRLKLTAHGKTAHGARPWLGENAVEILMDDLRAIRPLFDLDAPDHWHRTLNLGWIRGGTSVNQVPDRAEAKLDIRYTEDDDPDRLAQEVTKRVRSQVEVLEREPLFFGQRTAHVDRLMELIPGLRLGQAHGASDARFLSSYGMAGIVWGADGENTQHSLDEHVVIESVDRLYRAIDRLVQGA